MTTCPHCGSEEFFEGPHGGLSVNVKCRRCGAKFCYMGPFGMEPIDNDDRVYGREIRLTDLEISKWEWTGEL